MGLLHTRKQLIPELPSGLSFEYSPLTIDKVIHNGGGLPFTWFSTYREDKKLYDMYMKEISGSDKEEKEKRKDMHRTILGLCIKSIGMFERRFGIPWRIHANFDVDGYCNDDNTIHERELLTYYIIANSFKFFVKPIKFEFNYIVSIGQQAEIYGKSPIDFIVKDKNLYNNLDAYAFNLFVSSEYFKTKKGKDK